MATERMFCTRDNFNDYIRIYKYISKRLLTIFLMVGSSVHGFKELNRMALLCCLSEVSSGYYSFVTHKIILKRYEIIIE